MNTLGPPALDGTAQIGKMQNPHFWSASDRGVGEGEGGEGGGTCLSACLPHADEVPADAEAEAEAQLSFSPPRQHSTTSTSARRASPFRKHSR